MYIDDETKFIQICIYKKNELYNNIMNNKKTKEKKNTVPEEQIPAKLKTKKRKEKCLRIFIKYKLQCICRSFY